MSNQTVWLAIFIGFFSGIFIGCIDVVLDRWVDEAWWGWRVAVRNIVLQAIIYMIFMGAGTFIFTSLAPFASLEETNETLIKVFRFYVFGLPVVNLVSKLINRQERRTLTARK
jgi:MFS family permease